MYLKEDNYAKDWQYSKLHSCYMYMYNPLTTVDVKKNPGTMSLTLEYTCIKDIFLSLHWINSRKLLNLKTKTLPIISTSITLQHTA